MNLAGKTKEELIDELAITRMSVSMLDQYYNKPGQPLDHFYLNSSRSFPRLANMQEGLVIVFDRKLKFVNDIFSELFSISPEEACSPEFDPMSLIAPESRRYIRQQYQEGCNGGYRTKEIHYTGLSKDGRKIDCETLLLFIPYKWGIAIQCTLNRVSVSKRIDEILRSHQNNLPVFPVTPKQDPKI